MWRQRHFPPVANFDDPSVGLEPQPLHLCHRPIVGWQR